MNEYIHSRDGWPIFAWDAQVLAPLLAAVRHDQGRLLGRMSGFDESARADANLDTITADVVKSSAIEGERLDSAEVRSSVAQQLGLDVGGLRATSRHVDGVVEMMLDATQNHAAPLTQDRLFGWHAALFPIGRSGMRPITTAAWRVPEEDPMRVVSGAVNRQTVHFEAPPADRVPAEMAQFLAWFEAESGDLLIHAGIAHLWFLTVHPFADGNGRIARAMTDLLLARSDRSNERFYSMSAQIAAERKQYYLELEAAQRGGLDVTAWLEWFLGCFGRAIEAANTSLNDVFRRVEFWRRAADYQLNDRQRRVLHRMLHDWEGFLTTRKYVKIAGCSADTALRDIRALVEFGLLSQNEAGGRSTSYSIVHQA